MGQTESSQPVESTFSSLKLEQTEDKILETAQNREIKKLCAIDFGTTHLSILYCDYVSSDSKDVHENCGSVFGELKRTSAYFLFQPKSGSKGDNDDDWICTHVGAAALTEHKKIRALNKHISKRYCLFSNFKMSIYDIVKKDIKEDECKILPIDGEKRAFQIGLVLSKVLKYLTDLSMTKMKMNDSTLHIVNVKWMLTVPAIWEKKGAMIMLSCFKKEWIGLYSFTARIECVLEPEMATIQAIAENSNIIIPVNKNAAVFDVGGGTSDLYIFTYNSLTREISGSASSYGSALGGENIDKEMLKILKERLTIEEVEDNLMSLRTKWEEVKPTIDYDPDNDEDLFFASFFDFAPSTNNNSSKINVMERNVFVNRKCVYDIYQTWAKENAKLLFEKMQNTPIEMIILVGGMFESVVFYNLFKYELINSGKFQENNIIVTKNPKLAIIRGAILHGLKKNPTIVSRISSHTYGFACRMHFSTLEEERKKKLQLDQYKNKLRKELSNKGEDNYLRDSIFIFIKEGESIPLDWEKVQNFVPGAPNEKSAVWKILESDEEYPMLESECRVIATFEHTHPEEFTRLKWKDQNYTIRFSFTNTINVSIKYDFETGFKSIPQLNFKIK